VTRPTRGGSIMSRGGPCRSVSGARPAAARTWWAGATSAVRALPAEQREGVRLTGGPRQQCRAGPVGQWEREIGA
jgi:hypothetical protein